MGLCFAMFVFLTFRGPLASHDSNPYPNRSRIARYDATKVSRRTHKLFGPVNPGTTSRSSQGHLDVKQSKKFMFVCLFSPGLLRLLGDARWSGDSCLWGLLS